ncbi:MAG TPA: hypothetical protein VGS58_16485, partial [Candidatus Sulfopaludibacter sp.]|nr:hypothetical protein [Candidatus Sulfopaludibacter sp.]
RMNRHRYLLAYMSGTLLPTWALFGLLTLFILGRFVYDTHIPVERMIPFPMAVVPNLWGLWNLLYLALGIKGRMSLGAWGALLPLILVPSGLLLAHAFGAVLLTPAQAAVALPLVIGLYYLLWKVVVGFFNAVAGLG